MKRNSLFMLVLTLLVSTVGVYFLGCDDTTVESQDVVPDKVHGSIHGTVVNAITNEPIPGVIVYYFAGGSGVSEKEGDRSALQTAERDSVITGSEGQFHTVDTLPSGYYQLQFVVPGQFATGWTTAYIKTLEELKGDIDVNPSGVIRYETVIDFFPLPLYPSTASLTGVVMTALPDVLGGGGPTVSEKETGEQQALQNPPSPVPNVEVRVTYPGDLPFYRLAYTTATNASGVFEFENLPAYEDTVMLSIMPFTAGDTSYLRFDTAVVLVQNHTVDVGNKYGLVDCVDLPAILSQNFNPDAPFNYDGDLAMRFSEAMDTLTFDVSLTVGGEPWVFDITWSAGDSLVTLSPRKTLFTDETYTVTIHHAESKSGCDMNPRFDVMNFTTMDGIDLLSTNAERVAGEFDDYTISDDLDLDFNMPPVINPTFGHLTLLDVTDCFRNGSAFPQGDPNGDCYTDKGGCTWFPVSFDASVNGNTLVIDPVQNLERDHVYEFSWKVFSSIQGDFHEGCFTFWTEPDTTTLDAVTGFAVEMDDDWTADWNTTEITFRWDTKAKALGYKVYARDDSKNTDFVQLHDFAQQDFLQHQERTVQLWKHGEFDLYGNDGFQTPFSGGVELEFQVRAYNRGGDGAPSSSVFVEDETPPEFALVQAGNADRVGKDEDTVVISVLGTFAEATGAYTAISYDSVCGSHTGGALLEYLENAKPGFTFVEAGGTNDPLLTDADVMWDDENNLRGGTAWFMVPMGTAAAGDSLIVEITDNSGNTGTAAIRLLPNFEFIIPTADSGLEAGPTGKTVKFVVRDATDSTIQAVHAWLSLDGGTTFIDTVENIAINGCPTMDLTNSFFTDSDPIDWDTVMVDANAMVQLQDTAGGSFWTSDLFTISGIMMTGPDSLYIDTTEILDRGVTDSVAVPLTWNSVGFDDNMVEIWYFADATSPYDGPSSVDDTTEWTRDTLVGNIDNTGTYDWYPPVYNNQTYMAWVRLADADMNMDDTLRDSRPADMNDYEFMVFHDMIQYVDPFPGPPYDIAKGGQQYDIRWWNKLDDDNDPVFDTFPSILTIDYLIAMGDDTLETDPENFDEGDWRFITDTAHNEGGYGWRYPPWNEPTYHAWIRITDANGEYYYSPKFTIAGLLVTQPDAGDDWDVGSAHYVLWENIGNFGLLGETVNISYWDSDEEEWVVIPNAGAIAASAEEFLWDPIDNVPDSLTRIRVQENSPPVSGQGMYDTTDLFVISGYEALSPLPPDTIYVSDIVQLQWATIGDPDDGQVWIDFAWYYDPVAPGIDTTWVPFAVNNPTPNDGAYSFTVPNDINLVQADIEYLDGTFDSTVHDEFMLRVRADGGTAVDEAINPNVTQYITVAVPSIAIYQPDTADIVGGSDDAWMMGTEETITWNSIGVGDPQEVTIQLQEYDVAQSIWVLHSVIATGVPSSNRYAEQFGTPVGYHEYDWDIPILLDTDDIDSARIRIVGDNVIEAAGDIEGFSQPFQIIENPGPVSTDPGSATRPSKK